MVFIKKEKNNSLNKVSDLEHFNQSYNSILEFLLQFEITNSHFSTLVSDSYT